MLNFIRRLFSEPKKEQHDVKLSELRDWFNKNTKQIFDELNKEIKYTKENIASQINKTKEDLKKLENATLPNPNITMREKQFMYGNRDSYIRSVNVILNSINMEDDHDSLLTFADFFSQKMDQFARSTARAYHILQEFLGNESKEIAMDIKNLDNSIKGLKQKIISKNIDKVLKLKKEIEDIDKKKFHKIELNKELKQQTKQQEGFNNQKNELEKRIKVIQSSEEHNQYRALSELKRKYADKLEEFEKRMGHSFSTIDSALKKYERIAFRDFDLIADYRKDPIRTLIKDTQFKIIEMLDQMRKGIISGTLELKDSKKERTLKEIEKLTKEYFEEFLEGIGELKNKIEETNAQIESNKSPKELENLKEQLAKMSYDLDRTKSHVVHLNDEIDKLDFDKIKKKTEEEIKDLLEVEISIS